MSNPVSDPGETSLSKLLSTLTTTIHPSTFVFTTHSDPSALPPFTETQLLFRESEGITVITSLDYATTHSIDYFFPCKMITCNVTSSLEAVGFMAVLATKLAEAGMGVNPVSGFYHDHLFVSADKVDDAVVLLNAIAKEHST